MFNMVDIYIYVNMLNFIDSDYCIIDDIIEEWWKKIMIGCI